MSRPVLGQGLHQRAEQRLELAPRMLQSIELLGLPVLELDGWLERASEENEALVLEAREARVPRGQGREATQRHAEWLESQPCPGAGLVEHVLEELALLELEPGLERWARLVVGALDERGWLALSDEELADLGAREGLPDERESVARAVAIVQGLEPRGLAARDALESLRLQLDPRDADHPLLCRLLDEFLEALAHNRRPAVARALGIELARLEELLAKLAALDPRPAAGAWAQQAPVLAPDLVVEPRPDGTFELRQERGQSPAVSIDPGIEALARDPRQGADVRRYLRDKLERARWIVEAVELRGRTLQSVAAAAFAHQREFLRRGPGHLVPLSMTDLAAELELAPSTISRAVAGKHVQTPWGILPLRELFQASGGSGRGTSCDELREAVRRAIEAEDPAQPLSDEDLVKQLRKRGLEVARRSVARYRTELGIASSYLRRRFDSAG